MMKIIYDDSAFISPDTITLYANTNEVFLTTPVRGIILEFPGLGGGSCLGGTLERQDYDTSYAKAFGEEGIVLAYLFPGPWSWGNNASVRMADGVVCALTEKYGLPEGFPLGVSGGSMGGQGALIYAAETRFKLRCAAVACPCIDVLSAYSIRTDFPRTFFSAAAGYDLPIDKALEQLSPVHRLADLPDMEYFISANGADELFPEEEIHAFVRSMEAQGRKVVYRNQPGTYHGQFTPEVRDEMHTFLLNHIGRKPSCI